MYYCGWEKRTDIVTNTTTAILYTKVYYCGLEKRTDCNKHYACNTLNYNVLLLLEKED